MDKQAAGRKPTREPPAVPTGKPAKPKPSNDNETPRGPEELPQTPIVDNLGDEFPKAPRLDTGSMPRVNSYHRYPRISRPAQLMRESYDVVVIGTGYGGGVAASRMARGRQTVCVLERGKERWPGEFPETFRDAIRELRVSGRFSPGERGSLPQIPINGGNPTGLYHFALGAGQNIYMGNGLGGSSLVNANVFLEPTPAILNMSMWPKELRGVDVWRKCE